ncbi:hypothetical protein MRS44_011003 [Fusarium solani]|uniref:uncharacterized protein n=1 Tax=Fusarium solani TaxID=169388 RepID=UPI0032C43ACD|nr:hypothetical protein MRS44_011003 [Fusarium solani]
MEAIEAVSLAANILQFTIFAKDCYVEIREIRESAKGLTKKDAKLVNSTSRREKMLRSISIRDTAEKCQRMASDLSEDIESRSAKKRSNVLKMAFNVAIRRHKIPEVEEKIAEWEDLKKDLFRLLNIHIRLASLVWHTDDLDRMKSDILDAISKESESQEAALDVSTKLFEWTKRVYSLKKEQVILQSLRFDEMVDRRGGIVEAQPCTFEWVEKPKLSFLEWLSKDDGVYWVTGHPGSGKSTFMKYLSHHTKTHQKLVQWAAPKTLVTASFYFWFSGTALQKSQEGLLRSLLFQILRQCPCLIPRTLKSWTLNSTSTKFFFLIDSLDEYQDHAGPRGGKEGGVSAYVRDIIEVINVLADLQDIKLCVSSRPWPAFENAFGQATDRKLYVHNENREDIGRNIRERFTSSPAYQKSFIPPKDLRQLSDSMVEDSRGAFLWVSLVVESLLQGLENGDRVDELRKRFEETPKTLHAMFERMLDSVEERYHEQAAQILQVAFHARAPMYVAVYSFIGDDDLLFEGDPKPWSEQDCIHKSRTTEDRLKVRCPDLIMIQGNPSTMTMAQRMTKHQVEFLHRTVKDFLSLEDTQKMLRDRTKEPFDPTRPMKFISKALLAHIRGAKISGN